MRPYKMMNLKEFERKRPWAKSMLYSVVYLNRKGTESSSRIFSVPVMKVMSRCPSV
jgi:hypothetical protein